MTNFKKTLTEFLKNSKTAYHTVANIEKRLKENGYVRLYENEKWELEPSGKYYVIRNGSSLIAFKNNGGGFMIAAAHSDSPSFRIKGGVRMGNYVKLETERYGGMINYTWLDRPLSAAGRMTVRADGGLETRLCDSGNKTFVIPSLAIHMNRTVNESLKLNPAKDLLPLASLSGNPDELFAILAESAGAKLEDVVAHEIFLVAADEPKTIGLSGEILLSPRLDDLSAVCAALEGHIASDSVNSTPVLAVFDNEEVGSETKQGAASTLLYDVLKRISDSEEDYMLRLASSFMVSADNAHALHPNHPEMADGSNAPILGGGIAIKYNANQRYATDSVSDGIFREICKSAGIRVQSYFNRADLPGGSTLGSISDTRVSIPTVDIGIPQLAMHSANECLALSDAEDMKKVLELFFCKSLSIKGEKITIS